MRLYVAGPMSAESFCGAPVGGECADGEACRVHGPGAPDPWDFNYPAFAATTDELTAAGFDVESPASGGQVAGWGWSDYMRRGLRQLLDCEGVAVLDGWQNSRGATLEVSLATYLGMPVKPARDWISG